MGLIPSIREVGPSAHLRGQSTPLPVRSWAVTRPRRHSSQPGTGDGWSVRADESAPVSLRPHLGFRHEDRGAPPSSYFVLKIQLTFREGGVCGGILRGWGDFIYYYLLFKGKAYTKLLKLKLMF